MTQLILGCAGLAVLCFIVAMFTKDSEASAKAFLCFMVMSLLTGVVVSIELISYAIHHISIIWR